MILQLEAKIKRWSEKHIISLGTEKKLKVWFLSNSLEMNVFELMLGFVFEMEFELVSQAMSLVNSLVNSI